MTVETVTIPLVSGKQLVFRKLDDGEAMRLLRAFFRLPGEPESVEANVAFLELLAVPLLTPHDPALVAHIRQKLPVGHSNLLLSEKAHWLAVQIGSNPADPVRAVAVLADLPAELMRQMSTAAQGTPRGKPKQRR